MQGGAVPSIVQPPFILDIGAPRQSHCQGLMCCALADMDTFFMVAQRCTVAPLTCLPPRIKWRLTAVSGTMRCSPPLCVSRARTMS